VVIIEYNAVFGPERAVVVPYSDGDVWTQVAREHRYLGASIQALVRLGRRKGYRLVAVEPDSSNAFFLRDDYRPEVPAVEPAAVFQTPRKYLKAEQARTRDIYAICKAEGLALVEGGGGRHEDLGRMGAQRAVGGKPGGGWKGGSEAKKPGSVNG